jgi:hypothetical protein
MDPDSILAHVAFTTSGSLVDCIDSASPCALLRVHLLI